MATIQPWHEAEDDSIDEGAAGESFSMDPGPTSAKFSDDPPAYSSASAPVLRANNLKNASVNTTPCEDEDMGTIASSLSSVETQAQSVLGTSESPGCDVQSLRNGRKEHFPPVPDHHVHLKGAQDGSDQHYQEASGPEVSLGTASAADEQKSAAVNCAVPQERSAVSARPQDLRRYQEEVGRLRNQQGVHFRLPEPAVVNEGGGVVVDLRRARQERLWNSGCLACREENPAVWVMPCCHAFLCQRCFFDPHFLGIKYCPVCTRPSEGLKFSADMLLSIMRRSQSDM
ncbi:uncharacterized protein LOC143282748 [Babylonia areolata]|uniref:uncharacterized protein LOC143282748 n=1 Tax=Babylonia areolata TaxID=304850 RepID=UPI003FD1A08A